MTIGNFNNVGGGPEVWFILGLSATAGISICAGAAPCPAPTRGIEGSGGGGPDSLWPPGGPHEASREQDLSLVVLCSVIQTTINKNIIKTVNASTDLTKHVHAYY